MLDACCRPDLVAEITLQPVRRYGVDAAIFFSDIVVPLKAIGVDLDIKPGVGPVVAAAGPRPRADLDRLRAARRRATSPYVAEAVRSLVAELGADAADRLRRRAVHARQLPRRGRPVAATTQHTKALMYGDPELWHDLLDRLAEITGDVPAGAGRGRGQRRAAVRLLGRRAAARADYRALVLPHSPRRCSSAVADLGVPRIHFGVGTGELLARDGRRPAPTSSASTGGCRSTRPPAGSAPACRCRATSTRRCCSRRWRRSTRPRSARCWPTAAGPPGPRLQPRPRRAAGDRPRRAGPRRRAGARDVTRALDRLTVGRGGGSAPPGRRVRRLVRRTPGERTPHRTSASGTSTQQRTASSAPSTVSARP